MSGYGGVVYFFLLLCGPIGRLEQSHTYPLSEKVEPSLSEHVTESESKSADCFQAGVEMMLGGRDRCCTAAPVPAAGAPNEDRHRVIAYGDERDVPRAGPRLGTGGKNARPSRRRAR